METVPGSLIWEIVKKNNSFLVKQFGNGTQSLQFSEEPNNLCNRNSFKYSGLANKKTIAIEPAGKDQSVLLATTNAENVGQPFPLLYKSVMKKKFSSMVQEVSNQVANNFYRPDLEQAAVAKLRAIRRSLKAAKSAAKLAARSAAKKKKRDEHKAYGKLVKQLHVQLKAGRWKGSPTTRLFQMNVALWREKKRIYEVLVSCCPYDEAEAMEVFVGIMTDVMGSHKVAQEVIVENKCKDARFRVRLKRADLEKLVLRKHPSVSIIYDVRKPKVAIHKRNM